MNGYELIPITSYHNKMSQAKHWCFTLNNPTDEEIEQLKNCDCRFIVFQKENAPGTGTLHLQGYLMLDTKKRLSYVKLINGRAHWEIARGTPRQNIDYCTKAGGFDVYRRGIEPSGQGKATVLDDAIHELKSGKNPNQLVEKYATELCRYHRGLDRVYSALSGHREWKTEVSWFFGKTGTGKSRAVYDICGPTAYYKMPCNKWWDGYFGQEDVIIDDYRRDMCTFGELLRLFDRYPHRVETKGGSQAFLAKRIFITTPKSPRDTWIKDDGSEREDIEQLLRRIELVREF